MSDYPIWWDTTVTIYNKYENPVTNVITWQRTVVPNCFWKYVGDKLVVSNTILEVNTVICRIPKNSKFIEKYNWVNLSNTDKLKYFTIGRNDIIIRGEVTDNIDEYTSGYRSTDIISKYKDLQGCMEVQGVSLNIGKGRNNEHYLATGS